VFILAHAKRNGFIEPSGSRSTNETDGKESPGQDNAFNIEGASGIRRNVAYSDNTRELQSQRSVEELRGWVSNGGKNVAYPNNQGLEGRNGEVLPECTGELFAGKSGPYVANAEYERSILPELTTRHWEGLHESRSATGPECDEFRSQNSWDVEPSVGRVANGIPNRVDRLKCLGNAVVPQQAYPIFKAIADIENGIIKVT
jgi:DNA (cytosine-5)-methyltransferase 1